jgi:essential nuclear protein 1
LRTKSGKKKSKDGDEEGENFVDAKASKNILRIGRELAEEDGVPQEISKPVIDSFGFDSRFDDDAEGHKVYGDEDEAWGDEEEVEEIEVDPEDLETYKKFMPDEEDDLLKHGWDRRPTGDEPEGDSVNLADLILEKIAAFEAKQSGEPQPGALDEDYELPPKVVEVYTK